jgi:mannose-6-phosphate isomerase-like protein (cupin superfamily)
MDDSKARFELRREADATVFMDDGEMVLRYFQTDKILFSASTLAPGERSNRDPGHARAHEIGYCEAGQIVLQFGDGDDREYVRMGAGDAVLINEGVPHTLFNPGPEQARVTWSIAPSLGRAQFTD